MPRRRPSTTPQHDGPDAARLPMTEVPLPGVDPAWSRTVTVASTAPVEPVPGRRRRWHVLDNAASLEAAGLSPRGTVLAVHGNPTWSYLWRDVLAAGVDPANPWRVVAVDQLDMGFSERTGLFRRLDDRVRDLGDLTAALGLDAGGPVVTLAHDWGGLISSGWALEHPDAHAATVLTNTALHHDGAQRIPAALRLALAPAAHGPLTERSTAFLDAALALADPVPPKGVRAAYRAPYRTRSRREAIGRFVADIPAAPGHPSHARFERIAAGVAAREVPALLLWGSGDPVFQERYLLDLMRRFPHADVHRFEGARHLLPEARDVAGPVLAWLADRFGPGPARRELHLAARADAAGTHVPFPAQLDERRTDPGLAVVDMAPAGGSAAGKHAPTVRASLSWAELARRVDRLAAGLDRIGVRAGDRVNLMVPPGSELTTLFYACLRIGAVVVVADTGLGPKGLTRALKGAAPVWLVGVRKALVAGRALGWPGTRISVEALDPVSRRALGVAHDVPELLATAPRADLPAPDPDADAAVLFTSGSTGPAKGVVYTHRRLSAMRDAVRGTYGLTAGTGLVAGFAPFALLGPAMGTTSVTPDMDVTAPKTLTARALADAAAAIRATAVFLSPAAIANVLATRGDLDDAGRAALARVELMLSAGAPLPEPLLERLQGLMPGATLHTPYGMTEGLPLTDVTLGTIQQARLDGAPAGDRPAVPGAGNGVCVGTAVHGAELAVTALRPDGGPGDELTVEAGVTGEIVARAPHVKDRYDRLWHTEHLSTRLPGWHRTGDVGHFDAAGRLWVEGRLAHVIVAAGGVLTPVAAEHAAQDVPGVRRAAVVGVGPAGRQVPVAVVETVPPATRPGTAGPELSAAVRTAVREATGADLAAVLVVVEHPTDIRHNSKIDRALLARWASDALAGGRIRNP